MPKTRTRLIQKQRLPPLYRIRLFSHLSQGVLVPFQTLKNFRGGARVPSQQIIRDLTDNIDLIDIGMLNVFFVFFSIGLF